LPTTSAVVDKNVSTGRKKHRAAIKKKVREKRKKISRKVKHTHEKVRDRTEHSPWLARLVALAIGIIDGSVVLLSKVGMDAVGKRIGGEGFDPLSPAHWGHVFTNPYIIIVIVLGILSIIGMTAAFSHERSHRLFAVIGGTSYSVIVVGSAMFLGEKVALWVILGVVVIVISLFISNLYQGILWFKDKVNYLSGLKQGGCYERRR